MSELSRITGEQLRAARAFARLDQAQVARRSGLSLETIKRLEAMHGPVGATLPTLEALVAAFRKSGVTFTFSPDGGLGVRGVPSPRGKPAPEPVEARMAALAEELQGLLDRTAAIVPSRPKRSQRASADIPWRKRRPG